MKNERYLYDLMEGNMSLSDIELIQDLEFSRISALLLDVLKSLLMERLPLSMQNVYRKGGKDLLVHSMNIQNYYDSLKYKVNN